MKINPQLVNWLKRNIASDTDRIAIYENGNLSLEREMILTCLHAGLIEFGEYTGDVIYYQLTPQGEILLERTDPATEPAAPPAGAREPGQLRYQAQTWDTVSQDWTLYAVIDTETGERVTEPTRLMTFANMQATAMNAAAHLPQRTPATPQPATVGTGDGEPVYTLDQAPSGLYAVLKNGGQILFVGELDSADKIERLLNTETRALRTELAAARERIAALTKYADGLAAENSALGIVISSVGIKVNDARDLLFAEKYAAADGELKNAQVIIQRNNKDALD